MIRIAEPPVESLWVESLPPDDGPYEYRGRFDFDAMFEFKGSLDTDVELHCEQTRSNDPTLGGEQKTGQNCSVENPYLSEDHEVERQDAEDDLMRGEQLDWTKSIG